MYALGLVPNPSRTQDVKLYLLNESTHKLIELLTLASNPDFILADLQRSVIAAAYPADDPKQVNILRTDLLTSVQHVFFGDTHGDLPYDVLEVEDGKQLYAAFALGHTVQLSQLVPEPTLTGVSLFSKGGTTKPLPFSAIATPRVVGLVGDQFPQDRKLVPEVRGNPSPGLLSRSRRHNGHPVATPTA